MNIQSKLFDQIRLFTAAARAADLDEPASPVGPAELAAADPSAVGETGWLPANYEQPFPVMFNPLAACWWRSDAWR